MARFVGKLLLIILNTTFCWRSRLWRRIKDKERRKQTSGRVAKTETFKYNQKKTFSLDKYHWRNWWEWIRTNWI